MKTTPTDKEIQEVLSKFQLTQEDVNNRLACNHKPITFHTYILKNLDLSDRDLSNIFFAGILIENVNFKNSNLSNTSFYGSIIKNVNFDNSIMSQTIFTDAEICHSSFKTLNTTFLKKIYLYFKNLIPCI